MRVCGQCRMPGHNKATCKVVINDTSNLVSEEAGTGRSLQEIGREILKQQNVVVERTPDEIGTIPRTGLWLVNLQRKRVAGKISQVKKEGTILWTDCWGCLIESEPETIKLGGYLYLELESPHLMYEVTAKGQINK